MTPLKPFFRYSGSKYRWVKSYPRPRYDTIAEPFAGSAGYSLHYHDLRIVLADADQRIHDLWVWLVAATPEAVLALPDASSDASGPGKTLIALWESQGAPHALKTKPKTDPTYWRERGTTPLFWGRRVRERIAAQLEYIRHWQIVPPFVGCSDLPAATYFADPPYQRTAGVYGARVADYGKLARWFRSLPGQVIVCDRLDADYLPFTACRVTKNGAPEAVYLQGNTAAGDHEGPCP